MSDRTERFPKRTLNEFIERGLYPCNGCISEALRYGGEPLFGRRVHGGGVEDAYPMVSGACTNCGFVVWSNGAIRVSSDLVREMCRREAKADSRRPDTEIDAGSCVSTGGGPVMRHGDSKTEFGTGAQRDTDKGRGRPSLISPVLIHRLGVLLQEGAEHYGADNWIKGMPYRRTADSIIRHIFQWLAGDEEEDHLAAICFGAMCLMTYEETWLQSEVRLTEGPEPSNVMKPSLDDRDEGLKKILASILTSPSKDATLETKSESPPQSSLEMCVRNCGGATVQPSKVCLNCREKN